jgi:hypothetical protein
LVSADTVGSEDLHPDDIIPAANANKSANQLRERKHIQRPSLGSYLLEIFHRLTPAGGGGLIASIKIAGDDGPWPATDA